MNEKLIKFLKWSIELKLKLLKQLLKWLSGKKGSIASIILTVTGYLGAKGVFDELDVLLIGSLTTIIFGAASFATKKWIYSVKK